MTKIGILLLAGGLFLTSIGLQASEKNYVQQKELTESSLTHILSLRVLDTINNAQDIPGLKSEEFSALKTEIINTWDHLANEGKLEVSGADKDVRPYFVALQGVVEHVLALELQNEVKKLTGFIHTPMPATPLCTEGEISQDLVDPSIESDPLRLFTVQARTTLIRDYLFKGVNLYVVYPQNGLTQRTERQQKIYQQELVNYPNNLFDTPLEVENIPYDLIGATYLFQDQSGKTFVFAIKMTQAKDPQNNGNFGLWFGSADLPSIQERLKAVSSFMEQNGSDALKPLF